MSTPETDKNFSLKIISVNVHPHPTPTYIRLTFSGQCLIRALVNHSVPKKIAGENT